MRGGEEAPLDYSSMNTELGPVDPERNGYTYLRTFADTNDAVFPDEFGYEVDYARRENWDRALFVEILESNAEFITNVEKAFEFPIFKNDLEMTLDTMIPHVGLLREYVNLRGLEIRVLQLDGEEAEAFQRLMDLQSELERFSESEPGAMIGWLTSIALIGMFEAELDEFMAKANLPAEQWLAAARGYTLHLQYAASMRTAFRQEFQFGRHCIQVILKDSNFTADFSEIQDPNFIQRVFFWSVSTFGFKRNRTVNTFYTAYNEIIEQAELPVKDRQLVLGEALERRFTDERSIARFIGRNPYGEIILAILYPAISRVIEVSAMRDASSRAMQLKLALNAYYINEGQLPQDLSLLVPTYISVIPTDPFDGEPMRYSHAHAIVYSVGNDFVDNGGSELPFEHEISEDDYDDDAAENDRTEPSYPLRFVAVER